jgi:hypothetical protein
MRLQCVYCRKDCAAVTGKEVYPHRPDLFSKRFFQCAPCGATVGTHPDGRPLGDVASQELRQLRMAVHARLDPLWKSGKMKRAQAYQNLADKMHIDVKECHVGHFREARCKEASMNTQTFEIKERLMKL